MNIESSNINQTTKTQNSTKSNQSTSSSTKFSDELKELAKEEKVETSKNVSEKNTKEEEIEISKKTVKDETKAETIDDDEDTTEDMNNAFEGLNSVVKELQEKDLNQSDDKKENLIKGNNFLADNNNMINNDMNIQDNKDLLPQMNPNMNFSGDGQPFSSFMNNGNQNSNQTLTASVQDLAEESAILSTMAENIAMANKNDISQKTVTREEGIKKVDTKTGITVENIVKFDSIAMNEADVEVFTNLVQNGEIDLNNLAPKAAEKSVNVSKTLTDMLAKSMENNQPLRIDFDNNISVIIRVSRDGKISADFLPSSQVAEAYLKENLPLLRQKFEQNNLEYDELNQRERREQNRDNNRKKGQENE